MSTNTRVPQGKSDEATHPDPPVPQLSLRLLRKARYRIPRYGPVNCRLWRMHVPNTVSPRTLYAVELKGLGSRRFQILGPDETQALAVFQLLVKGTVTPCALQDILNELPT